LFLEISLLGMFLTFQKASLTKKMAIAQSTPIETLFFQREEPLQVNLDSLVLALITVFNTRISQKALLKHLINFFNDLNLVIPEDLFSEIPDCLETLTKDKFLQNQKGEYIATSEGKIHGNIALKNFREVMQEYF
jgi:hypothetical protein